MKRNLIRSTRKQREEKIREKQNRVKAHKKHIRESLGFDKIFGHLKKREDDGLGWHWDVKKKEKEKYHMDDLPYAPYT